MEFSDRIENLVKLILQELKCIRLDMKEESRKLEGQLEKFASSNDRMMKAFKCNACGNCGLMNLSKDKQTLQIKQVLEQSESINQVNEQGLDFNCPTTEVFVCENIIAPDAPAIQKKVIVPTLASKPDMFLEKLSTSDCKTENSACISHSPNSFLSDSLSDVDQVVVGEGSNIISTFADKIHVGLKQLYSGNQSLLLNTCGVGEAALKTNSLPNCSISKSSAKGFKCTLCLLQCKNIHEFKRHLRTHTGEKPFPCDICGKAFSLKSNLKCHQRIHTRETPFQCLHCGERFVYSRNLKAHKSTCQVRLPLT